MMLLALGGALCLFSCEPPAPEPESAYSIHSINRFGANTQGWIIRFLGQSSDIDSANFLFTQRSVSIPFANEQTLPAWGLSFFNPCNCVNVFMQKKLEGLRPSRRHFGSVVLELASTIADDSTNASLSQLPPYVIKGGWINRLPEINLGENANWRVNVGAGNRGVDGSDLLVFGELTAVRDTIYRQDRWTLELPSLPSNIEGEMWLMLYIESFHPGKNDLAIREVRFDIFRED